jgi:hypothetical protein
MNETPPSDRACCVDQYYVGVFKNTFVKATDQLLFVGSRPGKK